MPAAAQTVVVTSGQTRTTSNSTPAVTLNTAGASLTNSGTVSTTTTATQAVLVTVTSTINNNGTISASGGTGVSAIGVSVGVLTLNNAVGAKVTSSGYGLDLYAGGVIDNYGTISGDWGIRIQRVAATITNRAGAVIESTSAHPYAIINYDKGLTLTNDGTIKGGDYAVYSNSTTGNSITNNGTIIGSTAIGLVDTANNVADTVTLGSASTTVGGIYLGGGNDTLTINAGAVFDSGADGSTGTDALILQGATGTSTLGGSFVNFESITKNGASSFVLSNAGNLGAATIAVNAGSLTLGGLSNANWTGATTVSSGATLVYDLSSDGTLAATISGAGNFTKQGAGTLHLSSGATWTGTTTISGGTLAGTSAQFAALTGPIVNNGGLLIDQASAGTFNPSFTGNGRIGAMGQSSGNFIAFGGTYNTGLIAGADGHIEVTGAVTSSESTAAIDGIGSDVYLTNRGSITHSGSSGGRAVSAIGNLTVVNAAGATILNNDTTVPGADYDFVATGIYADGVLSLENGGSITASGDGVVFDSLDTTGGTLNNLATGVIDAQHDGIYGYYNVGIDNAGTIKGGRFGVWVEDYVTVHNLANARIEGGADVGLFSSYAGAQDTYIENAGLISGGTHGVEIVGPGTLINFSTGTIQSTGGGYGVWGFDPQSITNAGLITTSGMGVVLYNGGTVINSNGGTIQSTGTNNYGILSYTKALNLTNDGTIIGGDYTVYSNSNEANVIVNNGTITGNTAIGLVDTVNNVADSVTLGSASTTTGGIYLGGGDDTLTINAGAVFNGGADGSTGTDALILQGASGTSTISGSMINFESIAKNGASSFILSNAGNLGTATIAVNAGSLTLGGSSSSNWKGATTIASGATLGYSLSGDSTLAATIIGAGNFTKSGAGNLTLTSGATWTGTTTISGGTLTGSLATLAGSSFSVASGANLVVNQSGAGTFSKTVSGSGTVAVTGQGSGNAITFTGSTGTNAFEGLANGHLAFGSAASVQLNGFRSAVFLSGSGSSLNNAGNLTVTTTNDTATIYAIAASTAITNSGTIARSSSADGRTIEATGALTLTNNLGGTISSSLTSGVAVLVRGTAQIDNYGTVTSVDGGLIGYQSGTITNYGTGSVSAINAIQLASGTVTNRGTVTANAAAGADATGISLGSGTINNYGTVSSTDNAVTYTGSGTVTNYSGTISGGNRGVWLNASSGSASVTNAAGATISGTTVASIDAYIAATIDNSGNIDGAANAISLFGGGTITNQSGGLIRGSAADGISVNNGNYATSITNYGTITGASYAIQGFDSGGVTAALTIGNYGTINGGIVQSASRVTNITLYAGSQMTGDIGLGGGADSLTVAGTLTGNVTLGGGVDAFTLTNGGSVSGTVNGGQGADTFTLNGSVAGADSQNIANIQSFSSATKSGTGTWTLTGTAANAMDWMISGGTLKLSGGSAIFDSSAVAVSSGATLSLLSNETIGVLSGAGNVTLGANTLTVAESSASTFSGILSGTGGLTKTGSATLTLSGANSYSGTTSVSGGTLQLGASNVLADGSALSVSSGATFGVQGFSDTVGSVTSAGTLSGTGTLTASSYTLSGGSVGLNLGTGTLTQASGTTTLNGSSAATSVAVSGGTLKLGASNRLADGAAVTIAGTLDLQGFSDTVASLSLSGNLNGTGTLTAATYALNGGTVNAHLGLGTITQQSGTTTLVGYTNAQTVNVNGGTLRLGASDVLSDTATLTVLNGATLDLQNFSDTVGSFSIAGTLTGTGILSAGEYHLNGGTFNLSLGGGRMYVDSGTNLLNATSGATTVAIGAATLQLGASNRLSDNADVSVATGGTLDLQSFSDTVRSLSLTGTLSGTGTLTADSYDLNGGTVNANLGAGTLNQVSGTSTLNGTSGATIVAVQAGTLALGASDRLADGATVTISSGATLALGTYSDTVGTLNLAGILSGSGTLTAGAYNLDSATVNANLGAGTLNQLTGVSTLNGTAGATIVAVQGGTLTLGANDRLADTAAVTVSTGAILDLSSHSDTIGSLTLSGTLSGTGTLTAASYGLNDAIVNANLGAGTLNQLSGSSMLNGTSGALVVAVQAGTLALGAANRLADSATVTVSSGATLDLGAYSDTVGTFSLSGTLSGSGTLTAATYGLNGATVSANLGAGVLNQLSGSSTLGGTSAATTVAIQGGTLSLGASNRLASTAAVSVSTGAALNLGSYSNTVGSLALSGTLSGSGTLAAATYDLSGATVNANLAGGRLTQLSGVSVLNGTSAAGSVAISGGTLSLGASDRLADTAAITITNASTFDIANFTETVGTLALTGILAGTGTLTAAEYDLRDATVNANLGTGVLDQISGTSILNGTAAAATVYVDGGTLRLGASNRLADGATLAVCGCSIVDMQAFNDTIDELQLGGTLNGTGTLTARKYALYGGTVNANLGAGLLYQYSGVSTLNGTSAASEVHVDGGTLTLGASDRIADTAVVGVQSTATLDLGSHDETIALLGTSGVISGTGTLTAAEYDLADATINANLGTGTLVQMGGVSMLNGRSAAGVVNLTSGTLQLGASDRLADGATVTVLSGTTLDMGTNSDTIGALRLAGTLGGSGTLTAGSYTLHTALVNADMGSGTIDQIGGTSVLNGKAAASLVRISDGTLRLGAANRLADTATVTVGLGSTLDVQGFDDTIGTLALSGTLSGTGTLTSASYSLDGGIVNANLGAGALTQMSGTSLLNGTSAAGTVLVQGGTLKLGASNRLADTAVVGVSIGATLDLGTNSNTIAGLALAGTLSGTGTLTAAQYQLSGATVSANLGVGTLFNLSGTSTLSGSSAASLSLVQGGTLKLGADERLADGSILAIGAFGTFDLAGHNETVGALLNGTDGGGVLAMNGGRLTLGGTNADSAYSGAITGTGTISKTGTGRMTLAGDFAYTGDLAVQGGTLALLGSIKGNVRVQGGTLIGQAQPGALSIAGGSVSPGGLASGTGQAIQPLGSLNAASLDVSGGTLAFDFGGQTLNFASDFINVSGATTLRGGTVQVNALAATSDYRFSQRYVLIQSGTLSGTFANGGDFATLSTDNSLHWRLRYDLTPGSVVLEVQKQLDFTAGIPAGEDQAGGNSGNVATALNGAAGLASDQWAATLNQIAQVAPADRAETFASLSGEAVADLSTSTAAATDMFVDLMQQRVSDGGGDLVVGTGFADARLDGTQNPVRAGASTRSANLLAAARGAIANRATSRGFWTRIFGGEQNLRGTAGQANALTEAAGVAAGFEMRSDGFTGGLAGGVTSVGSSVSTRASHMDGTLYQAGLYGSYSTGRVFVSGSVSVYGGGFDTQRTLRIGSNVIGSANGHSESRGHVFSLSGGYRIPVSDQVQVAAIGTLTAAHDSRSGFTEQAPAGLGLVVAGATRNSVSATGELRVAQRLPAGHGFAVPFFSFGIRYNGGDQDAQGSMRFSGAPVGLGTFNVNGARQVPYAALWSGGINAEVSRDVDLGVAVESAYADRLRESRATMRIRIGF